MSKRSKACEFTPKVRRAIKERDRGRCIFCSLLGNSGYPATQIMHYVGRAQGGLGVEKNGALGCVYHHQQLDNSDKRDAMKNIFRGYLLGMYEEWDENDLIYSKWGEVFNE